jgi:hypothetical protein
MKTEIIVIIFLLNPNGVITVTSNGSTIAEPGLHLVPAAT